MIFEKKVAIVTGGGTGLGRDISMMLAKHGATVVINCMNSTSEAAKLKLLIEERGNKAKVIKANVGSEADVKTMVKEVVNEFGKIDFLINNAGTTVTVPFSDLNGVSLEDWERIMSINVHGAFLCAREVAKVMKVSGEGSIVNISSVSGLRPGGSSIPYAVSKAAIEMLTKCLALALGPKIRVNAVAPGFMDTSWVGSQGLSGSAKEKLSDVAPLRKFSDLEDVSLAVEFLLRNRSMTGQTVSVDAGFTLLGHGTIFSGK